MKNPLSWIIPNLLLTYTNPQCLKFFYDNMDAVYTETKFASAQTYNPNFATDKKDCTLTGNISQTTTQGYPYSTNTTNNIVVDAKKPANKAASNRSSDNESVVSTNNCDDDIPLPSQEMEPNTTINLQT